jgi:hypothetical protein
MGRSRSFLGYGLTFIIFGAMTLGLWHASGFGFLARVGGVVIGMGALLSAAGLYFRWQGWE